jgi:CRISPR-associated protein Cas1
MSERTIYIFSDGELKRKDNTIFLETIDGTKRYVPIETTREIDIFGEVTLNKRALEYLSKQEILVHFFNHYEYYIGSFYPREHYNSGEVILQQCACYLDPRKRLDLAKRLVSGSLLNILKVLAYYRNKNIPVQDQEAAIQIYLDAIPGVQTIDELLAMEGNGRQTYYQSFDAIISSDEFGFDSRTRRPPQNRLNALISYGNSCLYTVVLSEIYKTHLDPRIGYVHTTNERRFTLNLDVADLFKPLIVDRTIFSLLNKHMIKAEHFAEQAGGIYMTDDGSRIFVQEFEDKLATTIQHREMKRNVSYRELVRLELYKIEKHILGDKQYEPFVARW